MNRYLPSLEVRSPDPGVGTSKSQHAACGARHFCVPVVSRDYLYYLHCDLFLKIHQSGLVIDRKMSLFDVSITRPFEVFLYLTWLSDASINHVDRKVSSPLTSCSSESFPTVCYQFVESTRSKTVQIKWGTRPDIRNASGVAVSHHAMMGLSCCIVNIKDVFGAKRVGVIYYLLKINSIYAQQIFMACFHIFDFCLSHHFRLLCLFRSHTFAVQLHLEINLSTSQDIKTGNFQPQSSRG